MLFRRPLIIESRLSVVLTRARLRACATTPYIADLESYRRRQIIGWRLSEMNESFLFQPEYGDILDVEGARFVALVEPVGAGARIRGFVMASPFTKVALSVWMVAIAAATIIALREATQPPGRLVGMAALMIAAAVAMVRYSLSSTSRIIAAQLHTRMNASAAAAA